MSRLSHFQPSPTVLMEIDAPPNYLPESNAVYESTQRMVQVASDTGLHAAPIYIARGSSRLKATIVRVIQDIDFVYQKFPRIPHEDSYQSRIDELIDIGNDEGVSIREESEKDFWHLVRRLGATYEASLVLTDDGNLIATWEEGEDYFDVEFLGNTNLEYLASNSQGESDEGYSTLDKILENINKFNLEGLLGIWNVKQLSMSTMLYTI